MAIFPHPQLTNAVFPKKPETLFQALRMSEAKDESQRDPRYLAALLDKMVEAHPLIRRHARELRSFLTTYDWAIEAYETEDADIAKDVYKRSRSIMNSLIYSYTEGNLSGTSLLSLEWKETSLGFIAREQKKYHSTEIERFERYEGEIAILKTNDFWKFDRLEIPEDQLHHFMIHHNPETLRTPGGWKREIIWLVYLHNLTTQEWSTFIKFLKGIIRSIAKAGAQTSEIAAAGEAVKKAVEHQYVSTTDAIDFDFQKIVDAASGMNFKEFIQWLEETIEISLTGTSSLASDRERQAQTVIERQSNNLAKEIRTGFIDYATQFLRHDYKVNVDRNADGDTELPYFLKFKPSKDLSEKIKSLNMLLTMQEMGADITYGHLTDATGIEFPDHEPDEVLSLSVIPGLLKDYSDVA